MGYEGGQQTGKEDGNHYSSDGFRIGKCEAEDNWTACSGGCNDYELGGQCSNSITGGNCQKDDGMAITITCSQPSTTVFNPSCTAYKQLGEWTNDGGCDATGLDKTCGPGTQKQKRTCIDGVSNKCSDTDITRTISCNDAGTALPECTVEKALGEWTNEGGCIGTGEDKSCGPGTQNQARTCVDGSTDLCADGDRTQTVSCADAGTSLPECAVAKHFGDWTNDRDCIATGEDKTCGPGTQSQTRTCTDGTNDPCSDADITQTVSCSEAGTALPACVVEKQLGEWTNVGECAASGDNKTCGPGTQSQTRTCTDGTNDVCTQEDTAQTISCADAGTALPDCTLPDSKR